MPRPFFSIITATFNCGSSLDIAAASVRRQNRDDIEYIVIDGGSTDDTRACIERNRGIITKVISEPDEGIYDAINKGIRLATGKFIGIIGADDHYVDGALDIVARAAAMESAEIIAGRTLLVSRDGKSELRIDEEFGPGSLVSGIPFGHNAMFASAHAYERVGLYDASYRIAADAQWVHRAIEANLSCLYLDTVLVNFSQSGVSTVQTDRIMRETERTILENFPALSREEALTGLYCVRGWRPVEDLFPLLERHNDERLHQSLSIGLSSRQSNPLNLSSIYPGTLLPKCPVHRQHKIVSMIQPGHAIPEEMTSGNEFAAQSEQKAPFFSIVIPAYNASSFIHSSLQSILSQPFKDYEIIVVDDGSTDDTPQILAEYQARDSRVRVHRQPNARQGAARTAGLKLARGHYVWCIDADDYIQTSILEKYYTTIRDKKPDVIVLNFAYVNPDGALSYSERTPGSLAGKLVDPCESEETFNAVSAWSCPPWRYVIKRNLISDNNLSFPSGLYYEDHPFAIELMLKAKAVYVDPSIGYFYVQRMGSTMNIYDGRVMDFMPIRRQCLDLLTKAGFLKRFPNISSKYIIPNEFVAHHVGPEYWLPFLTRIGDDLGQIEQNIVQTFGTAPQRGLLGAVLKLRIDGVLENATVQAMLALPVERYAREPVVHGMEAATLWSAEGPYPQLELENLFQWMSSDELLLRTSEASAGRRHFVLRFRNIVDNQTVQIWCNGRLERTVNIPLGNFSVRHRFDLELGSVMEPVKIIRIKLAKLDTSTHRRLGLLIEEIALTTVSAIVTERAVAESNERLIVGKGSTAHGVNLDIRVNPQERNYVRIGEESQISGHFVFERGIGSVTIGNRSSIGGGCLIVCSQGDGIHIGNHVMLSWDVTVIDTDAHSLDPEVRANDAFDWHAGIQTNRMGCFKDWAAVRSMPIRIEDNVWIGFGSAILKGVTIGRGAVVGGKSVVSRSIPAYTIFAGNPARFVKFVPRAKWTFEEIVAAAQAAPSFKEALAEEFLGQNTLAQFERLIESESWAMLVAELTDAGIRAQSKVMHIGAGNGVYACAFASLGLLVTLVEPCEDPIVGAPATKRLIEQLATVYPDIRGRIEFARSLSEAVDGTNFAIIHTRRFLQISERPRETLRVLSGALAQGGRLIADHEGLSAGSETGLPKVFDPYFKLRTLDPEDVAEWVKSAGLAFSASFGGMDLFTKSTLIGGATQDEDLARRQENAFS